MSGRLEDCVLIRWHFTLRKVFYEVLVSSVCKRVAFILQMTFGFMA